jgi:hypothetical protein
MSPIAIAEISAADAAAPSRDSAAPVLSARTVALRFRFVSDGDRALEALRYARRAMLREEGTRGVEEGEPSLEDAVFTTTEVFWWVPAFAEAMGRAKLEELVARANRALAEMPPPPSADRRA